MTSRIAALLLGISLGISLDAAAAPPDCTPHPQVDVGRIGSRALIVGELHGTVETPAFVTQLACSLLKAGRPVIVALERDGGEQAALSAYLSSAGQPRDVQALLASAQWTSPQQDGRSSQAMLALLEQLRRWRAAGHPVGVLAMQMDYAPLAVVAPPAPPAPRDAAIEARLTALNDSLMADKVWLALTWHPAHTVIALAGNWHTAIGSASRQQITPSPSFADVLARHVPVHVFGLGSAGGSAWNMGPDRPAGPTPVMPGPLYIADSRIDTQVDLGRISASPPAITATAAAAAVATPRD